jgi:hypothetical protein
MGERKYTSSLAERVLRKVRSVTSEGQIRDIIEITLDTKISQSDTDGESQFHVHYVNLKTSENRDHEMWVGYNAYQKGTTHPYAEGDPRGVIRALESLRITLEYIHDNGCGADVKVRAGRGFHMFYNPQLEEGTNIEDAILILQSNIKECEDLFAIWN